jgi:hypothetical protein
MSIVTVHEFDSNLAFETLSRAAAEARVLNEFPHLWTAEPPTSRLITACRTHLGSSQFRAYYASVVDWHVGSFRWVVCMVDRRAELRFRTEADLVFIRIMAAGEF